MVRVAVGLSGATGPDANGSLRSPGGWLWDVETYDENTDFLGRAIKGSACIPREEAHSCPVYDGESSDIDVPQESRKQATYVELVASNDYVTFEGDTLLSDRTLCIPYVTVTWADDSRYGWSGDWGRECGMMWFYSNIYVDSSQYKPLCTWLRGGKRGEPRVFESITIHLPNFTTNKLPDDPRPFCEKPAFDHYTQGLSRNQEPPDDRLVFSSVASHSVRDLCESPTSRGPDFVNRQEGLYCNMETSEVLPLCNDRVKRRCFEAEARATLLSNGTAAVKPYTSVM